MSDKEASTLSLFDINSVRYEESAAKTSAGKTRRKEKGRASGEQPGKPEDQIRPPRIKQRRKGGDWREWVNNH